MLSFHKQYAADKFSQNGEDGVVEEILRRLNMGSGTVVEFGAHNGVFCSNSRKLILEGWEGHLIEADADLYAQLVATYKHSSDLTFGRTISSPGLRVVCGNHFVTGDNVNFLLPPKCNVLSIDVDGIDYHIWRAYRGDPSIVIIEINSSLDPLSMLKGDPVRGSTYASMLRLGVRKGYFLLCHCGNMIFVNNRHRELFPELADLDPIEDIDQFFNTSWLENPRPGHAVK